jgi:hypothetical protein
MPEVRSREGNPFKARSAFAFLWKNSVIPWKGI